MKNVNICFKDRTFITVPNITIKKISEELDNFKESKSKMYFLIFIGSNQVINLQEVLFMEEVEEDED